MFKHVDEECSCEGRYCSVCTQTKCHRAFSKDSKGAFGLSSRCKDCVRDYQKSHIDQINAQRRKNRQEKADHYNAYNREYHHKNPEPKKARDRKYRQEHLEKIKIRNRDYKRTNERRKRLNVEYNRRYWQLHPEKIVSYWNNCRSRKLRAEGAFTSSEWKNLCGYYEYTCLCCRRCEPEIKLTVDHVVPLSKGGTNFIENIQPLCQSCNSSKQTKIIDYRVNWRRG